MPFLGDGEMRPVFLALEGDGPQRNLKSGVQPPLFLPSICSFIPPNLIYHYSPLLVPHSPLTPTYHTSHLYLAHSCRMEIFENY